MTTGSTNYILTKIIYLISNYESLEESLKSVIGGMLISEMLEKLRVDKFKSEEDSKPMNLVGFLPGFSASPPCRLVTWRNRSAGPVPQG
jgi:hypothetical protein